MSFLRIFILMNLNILNIHIYLLFYADSEKAKQKFPKKNFGGFRCISMEAVDLAALIFLTN